MGRRPGANANVDPFSLGPHQHNLGWTQIKSFSFGAEGHKIKKFTLSQDRMSLDLNLMGPAEVEHGLDVNKGMKFKLVNLGWAKLVVPTIIKQ
jgi:hypothetical protein